MSVVKALVADPRRKWTKAQGWIDLDRRTNVSYGPFVQNPEKQT